MWAEFLTAVQGAALSISVSLELILAFPIPLVGVMACDVLCSFLSFKLSHSVMRNSLCYHWSGVHHWTLLFSVYGTYVSGDYKPMTFSEQKIPHNFSNVMKPLTALRIPHFLPVSEKSQLEITLGNHNATLHIRRCQGFHERQNSQCSHILSMLDWCYVPACKKTRFIHFLKNVLVLGSAKLFGSSGSFARAVQLRRCFQLLRDCKSNL